MHNLFGYQISNATYQALLAVFPNKRPFTVGRSTFAGSGRFTAHWGGDNTSTWGSMFLSISQALTSVYRERRLLRRHAAADFWLLLQVHDERSANVRRRYLWLLR